MNTFHDPTQERCQTCGAPEATWAMTLHKNIGVIAAHWRSSQSMQVCRKCVHKEYWKRFALLVTVGWTSYYSIIIGPALLVANTVTYVKALTSKPTALPAPRSEAQVLPPHS